MNVWLIETGEPLPLKGQRQGLMRVGFLARALTDRGHSVLWWTSGFDHFRKEKIFTRDILIEAYPGCRIKLLDSIPYRKNLSLSRLVHHGHVAYRFLKLAVREVRPDLVVCVYPTIELSWAAVRYGRETAVPVVLDIHDLWPEFILTRMPSAMRQPAKFLARPYLSMAREAFRGAAGLIGITDNYLKWGLEHAGRPCGAWDRVFALGYERPSVSDQEMKACRSRLLHLGVDPQKRIVWFVATFGRSYDLSPVIEAVRELARRNRNDIQFVLTGIGEKLSQWQRQAKGLGNVIFTGWVSIAELRALMSLAQIGLAAYSRGATQGLSTKIFEYLAAGLPILSSLKGETESFLSDHECGLTYEQEDPQSFLKALLKLIDNADLRKKMSRNALLLYEERFSLERIYPRMVNYLEETAEKRLGLEALKQTCTFG